MNKIYDYYITPEEYTLAKKNGIEKATLEARIRKYGWDKKRALTQKPQQQKDRSYWMRIALKNGINKRTFLGRVNRNGWSEERAATAPVIRTKIRNRKYSDELYEKLEKNGIQKGTFYSRICRGWDIERASTEAIYTTEEKFAKSRGAASRKFRELNNIHFAKNKSRRCSG